MSETCTHHITVSWPINAYGDPTGYTACSLCGAVFRGEQRVQIVPAGAVVLTADEAATASYACSIAADAAYEPVEQDEYRALAAKLGGGA